MKPRDVLTCGGKHRIQPAWEPALRLDLLLVYSSEEPLRAVHLAPEKSLSRLCSCEYGFFNSPAPKSDQEAAGSLAIPVVRCGTPEGMPCGAIVPLTGWTAVLRFVQDSESMFIVPLLAQILMLPCSEERRLWSNQRGLKENLRLPAFASFWQPALSWRTFPDTSQNLPSCKERFPLSEESFQGSVSGNSFNLSLAIGVATGI